MLCSKTTTAARQNINSQSAVTHVVSVDERTMAASSSSSFAFKIPLMLLLSFLLWRPWRLGTCFSWRLRPDVSSGRFSFHVRYFNTNIWEFYFYHPFSFNILLFKENLSELQPCLRNAGNSVSECSILKISCSAGQVVLAKDRPLHC